MGITQSQSGAAAGFAIIVGAMKCGTTSLFVYLAQHSELSPCSIKEPDFFSDDNNWVRGFGWYKSLWTWNPSVHRWALEASTSYTKMPAIPKVVERMSRVGSRFRFIYILRDPLDRIESHHRHAINTGLTSSPIEHHLFYYITLSSYATQIEEYRNRFPADTTLLLNFEDLRTRPEELLQDVCRFLSVDPDYDFQGLNVVHNRRDSPVRDRLLWQHLRHLSVFRAIGALVPKMVKERIQYRSAMGAGKNSELSPAQEAMITRELRPDLERLHADYGFDISRWERVRQYL